jgi:hypothetical protein
MSDAVPSPAGEARRTLRDYCEHLAECGIWKCAVTFGAERCNGRQFDEFHYAGAADSHSFVAGVCTCGLDALLAADPLPAEDGTEKERHARVDGKADARP